MSLQTIVSNAPLADDVKAQLLARLAEEGNTEEVVAAIKVALQDHIESGFKALGVTLDPSDPQVKAIDDKFKAEVAAAEKDYNDKMDDLSIDAAVIQAQANKEIDTVQAKMVKEKMMAAV